MGVQGARDEALAVAFDRLLGALAAHRAAQALRLAGGEPGEGACDLDHLVLEDDRAERLAERLAQAGVQVRDLEVGVLASRWLRSM